MLDPMTPSNLKQTGAPVLVIAYRRPNLTAALLRRLGEVYPGSQIWVFVDGPRGSDDAEAVRAVEAVVSAFVDRTGARAKFSPNNLGCRQGVTAAIDWFFGQVDRGFILEDDCFPHSDFFRLGNFVLETYRDDFRVAQFSGRRQVPAVRSRSGPTPAFEFDYLGSTWGWATWASRWKYFDRELAHLGSLRSHERLVALHRLMPVRMAEIIRGYEAVAEGTLDTWDYPWAVSRLLRGGLSAVPAANLVVNRGYGDGATHTKATVTGLRNQFESLAGLAFSVQQVIVSQPFLSAANREARFVSGVSKVKRAIRAVSRFTSNVGQAIEKRISGLRKT